MARQVTSPKQQIAHSTAFVTYILARVRGALVNNIVLAVSPFKPVPTCALVPVPVQRNAAGRIVLTRRRRTKITCCCGRSEQYIIPLDELVVGVCLQAQVQFSLFKPGEV